MYGQEARLYDSLYAFKDYRADAERVHQIVSRVARSGGRRLLDVACGTGSLLAFLRDHFTVEGIDLSPEMLAVAREKCPGVPFHEGDMRDFSLGARFDAVVCLCSSIGYTRTNDGLRRAIATMAGHLRPGGALIVEPFFRPEQWTAGRTTVLVVDEPEFKAARLSHSGIAGPTAIIDYEYLVATPAGIEHFRERHELGLFTHEEQMAAFREAGLEVEHDPEGLGRGVYIGTKRAP
jgi:SAM-dependent methyltransferase